MSVDPTDCPRCSGFHMGWREGPPPCAADDDPEDQVEWENGGPV
jgi:hypothetical protein